MEDDVVLVDVVPKADVKIAICEHCPGHDMCERIDCDKLRAIDDLMTIELRMERTEYWQ